MNLPRFLTRDTPTNVTNRINLQGGCAVGVRAASSEMRTQGNDDMYGFDAPSYNSVPTQPPQPSFYNRDWSAETSGQMSGQMGAGASGHMSPRMGPMSVPEPPAVVAQDSSFLPRNISATLLGEGEGDEPPILEELGINFDHIYRKTKVVLLPRRSALDAEVVSDDDFAGPLLFCLVLGMLLLFNGKVFFAYIYGVFVVGLLGLWGIFNLMSLKGIDIYRTASVMGYSLLPIVFLAALSIFVDLRGWAGALAHSALHSLPALHCAHTVRTPCASRSFPVPVAPACRAVAPYPSCPSRRTVCMPHHPSLHAPRLPHPPHS